MTRPPLIHRSRSALAAAGTIAFLLAGMMQGGHAQAETGQAAPAAAAR